jgi:hypothetical protein
MFKVNPVDRPNINEVIDRLEEIGQARNVRLTEPLPQSLLSESQIQQPGIFTQNIMLILG